MDLTNLTKEYLKKLFTKGKRFDGRGLFDYRDIEIKKNISNKAEGSCSVKIGKTEVAIGVKIGVEEPYHDSPDKGNLICTGELLPLASPKYEPGPVGFKAIELGRLVDRAIRESGIIDFSKLVIKPGEKVWTIYIDIYPLNDDGSILDVATLGAIIALKEAKMPELDKEGKPDYSKRKETLPLHKEIAPLSFSIFKLEDSLIMDPTREEEEACDARITFGISKWNNQFMINSCQKAGSEIFTQEEIERIVEMLPKKYEEISKKIKKIL